MMELINVKGIGMDNITVINPNFHERYDPQIRAIAAKILKQANSIQDIDDCVNVVYLDLMEKLQQYNETRGSMGAFVSVVARSAALNYNKSSLRKKSELIGDDKIDFLAAPLECEDEVEFKMLVESILEQLNEKERLLFTMRYIYFYSPEDIAKTMQIKRSAVDMRVNRLKKKIKNFLVKGGLNI
jgi:RNA polymerase sigma-70 factor (ECF subfamily)